MSEPSLYERLGGVFAIAAVVNHFSDAVVKNPIVGQASENPRSSRLAQQPAGQTAGAEVHADAVGLQRRRWSFTFSATKPGSTALGLEEAHRGTSPPTSSTRWRPSWDVRWTTSGFPPRRRTRSWRRSRRTREMTEDRWRPPEEARVVVDDQERALRPDPRRRRSVELARRPAAAVRSAAASARCCVP